MADMRVGMVGAASFIGERLRPLLAKEGYAVTAFSRQGGADTISLQSAVASPVGRIGDWVYLAPIWTLPDNFELLENHGARRLVAMSSTSRFTKRESGSAEDRALAARLQEGEEIVTERARLRGWTVAILQPTLIYGLGKDKNISRIAHFIRRWGFFPLFGKGSGLRQPVHVDDVASACLAALKIPEGETNTYVLSGEEVVSYRTMVERIFTALGRKPRVISCPPAAFTLAVRLANLLPAYREVTTEMALRMDKDQHFDHSAAGTDLGFRPRSFHPVLSDVTSE